MGFRPYLVSGLTLLGEGIIRGCSVGVGYAGEGWIGVVSV